MKIRKPVYCDLHCHSTCSDGSNSRREIIERAIRENGEGTMILGISDHNIPFPLKLFEAYQKEYEGKITLVRACEVSTTYPLKNGRNLQVHINAIGCSDHPEYLSMLQRNHHDKRAYIEKILGKLEAVGVHVVDSYEELLEFAAPSTHIGRQLLARMMVKKGLTRTIDEGFDLYFGSHGKRTCYVDNPFKYVSIEDAVSTIRKAGGVPVLCHPFYYHLEEEELFGLIRHFKDAGGLALETEYSIYTKEQRDYLKSIASDFGLLESAGSDYHGNEGEHLAHHFPVEIYEKLAEFISQ